MYPGCITASVSAGTHTHTHIHTRTLNHSELVLDILNSIRSSLYKVNELMIHYTAKKEQFRNKDEFGDGGQ